MDSDGYLYFKSRDKDIIIRGGANLYPAEIESFIRTHPEVVDAQVFGVNNSFSLFSNTFSIRINAFFVYLGTR